MGGATLTYKRLVRAHLRQIRSFAAICTCVAVAAAMLCAACDIGQSDWQQESLSWPLKEAVFSRQASRLAIRAADGVELKTLAKLSLFGDFRPGVPINSIIASHGQPERTRSDFAGTYYEYFTVDARVEIAFEHSSSDAFGAAQFTIWSVYAYPHDPSLRRVFHPAIIAQIDRTEPRDLVVMTSSGDWLKAAIDGGQISWLRHYRVEPDGTEDAPK